MNRRLAALVLAMSVLAAGCSAPGAHPCGGSLAGFTHRDAQLGDVTMHYVIGGAGPPVVLLHGFPETWLAWRGVAPRLARTHTVIAPDLRGIGCSSLEPGGYDTQTLARDVHRLVTRLGFDRVGMVGHDMGGMVAFAYARTYPRRTAALSISGAVLPGFGQDRKLDFQRPGSGLAHLVFFMQPYAAELISGQQRAFFRWFITSPQVVASDAFDAYVRAYSRPGRLDAALGQYRTLHRDAAANRRGLTAPLAMPVQVIGGTRARSSLVADSLRRVAADVQVAAIPGAGHYVHEDRPAAFAAALTRLLRGVG